MSRKYIDCRDHPEGKCSIAISADNEEELIQAVVDHAVKAHDMEDTPQLRQMLQGSIKEGAPPT
jgi:predicted small metal-binding protein